MAELNIRIDVSGEELNVDHKKEYGCLPVTSTVMEHLKLIEETQEA